MVNDSPGLAHTARGDDDRGPGLNAEFHALLKRAHVAHRWPAEELGILSERFRRCGVERFGMLAIYLGDVGGHRAIDINRQARHRAGTDRVAQEVDDQLRAAEAERGNEHLAVALE